MAWNDLTDRQKFLDKAIGCCSIKLDSSDTCVKQVMRSIGATHTEYQFVKQRIELRLRAQKLVDKTDTFISDTENMLKQFEEDDKEWRRKGRTLGFDF